MNKLNNIIQNFCEKYNLDENSKDLIYIYEEFRIASIRSNRKRKYATPEEAYQAKKNYYKKRSAKQKIDNQIDKGENLI